MGVLDSILNLACLLLFLAWRSNRFARLEKSPPVSLAATLKKAEPRRRGGWIPFAMLVAILAMRSFFYWNIGSALNWTPSLHLGVISLPFRSDFLSRMCLFSVLSFGLTVAAAYAWLLLISVINRKVPQDDPFQRLVRLHLGWVERWPALLRFFFSMAFSVLLWGLGSPALVQLGIVPAPVSKVHLWEQALLLGVTSLFVWKFLVLGLCVLYMVNNYVYLGKASFWTFVNTTGSNLLNPLRRFPFCIGKVDFSPLLGTGLVLTLSHWSSQWLPRLFQRLPL